MQRPRPPALVNLAWSIALLAVGACQRDESPPPEELLFAASDLPGHWMADSEAPHAPTGQAPLAGGPGAIASSIVFFYHPAGDGTAGAHEEILLFRSERDAQEEFQDFLPTAFNDSPDWRWLEAQAALVVTRMPPKVLSVAPREEAKQCAGCWLATADTWSISRLTWMPRIRSLRPCASRRLTISGDLSSLSMIGWRLQSRSSSPLAAA
jgi:hypothetical protein